jgi:hypothetical protein
MGLFKRKKAEAAPLDPLAVLSGGIGSALAKALPGFSGGVALKEAQAEECRKWLSRAGEPLQCLSLHSGSTDVRAGFFLPASAFPASPAGPEAAIESFGSSWAETFPPSASKVFLYSAPVQAGKEASALWPLLELKAYALDMGGRAAWLFIEPSLFDAIVSRSPGDAASAQGGAPGEGVAVKNAHDFLALDPIAPRAFMSGKYRFGVGAQSFRFIPGGEAGAELRAPEGQDAAWFLAGFDLAQAAGQPPRKLSFIYSFHKGAIKSQSGGTDSDGIANALASGLFQECVREFAAFAKCQPQNPGIKRLQAPPDLSKAGSVLTMRAMVNGPTFRMPFVLAAPGGAVLPLLQAWLDAASVKRLQARPEALILSMNQRVLSFRLPEMLSPAELRKKVPQMLVSELLNHVSDSDYDLVLQNCLIASLGSKGLPGLFYYNESVPGADGVVRERILPLGPLDPRRLFSHMPEAFRDDYVAHSGQLHANPAALCISRNAEAMKEIAKAVSGGRIQASPRLAWLIREYFLKGLRAADEAVLSEMKAKGLPLAALTALEARLAQKAMARLDDRDAAYAVLDAPEQKEGLRKYISGARMGRLEEELSFLGRQYDSGDSGPEELLRAKRFLIESCKDVKRIDEEEARAAREREQARASAPPEPEKARKRR